jgi:hypothetical protein
MFVLQLHTIFANPMSAKRSEAQNPGPLGSPRGVERAVRHAVELASGALVVDEEISDITRGQQA